MRCGPHACGRNAVLVFIFAVSLWPAGCNLPNNQQPAQELRLVNMGLRLDRFSLATNASFGSDATALNNQAWTLMAHGELLKAENLLRRALQLDPAYAPALCNFGRLKQRDGSDMDMAANLLTKARLLMPNNAHILSSCALFMEEGLHSVDKASQIYEDSLKLHPSEHLLLNNYAQLLRTSGKDPVRAVELFNRALDSNPSSSESLNGLALLLSCSNRTQEAEAQLSRARALYPHDSNTLTVAAHIKLRNDDLDSSSSLFKQALQSDPANIAAAQNYAALLLRQRKQEEAIRCLEVTSCMMSRVAMPASDGAHGGASPR